MSERRRILLAAVALFVLTALSWGLAHAELGRSETLVALAIAAVKASVVAITFMEIGRAALGPRIVGIVTLSFIGLLCLGLIADVSLR